jgi:hypothetical protein
VKTIVRFSSKSESAKFNIRLHSFFFLCGVLFVGCKSIEPLAPTETIIDPPISVAKASYLSIPIEINLESYYKSAESSIPTSFSGKEKNCEGLSYTYQLKRDPILFKTNAQGLDFSTNLSYSLDLSYCPKCTNLFSNEGNCVVPRFFGSCGIKKPMRSASISFATKLEMASNFTLKSSTNLTKLDLIDPCEITLVNYDITSTLDKEIRKEMKTMQTEIDKEIGKIDIKSTCASAWKQLQEIIPIESYGYLKLAPTKIALSTLKFNQNKVYFDLGIESYPTIQTEKPISKPIGLPNLSEFKKTDGFQLNMDIFASYDSLNQWVAKSVQGSEFLIKGRKIRLDSVQIIGADGKRIHLSIQFSGARKGKLYFSAQPKLDVNQQIIYLSDIQFDLKTKSILLKSAKWLFNDQLTKKVEKEAKVDLKSILAESKNEITKALNQDLEQNIHLSGNVQKMDVIDLFPLKKGLFIRSEITGKLKLNID